MDRVLKIGASNKFFYYTLGERNTFNIKIRFAIPNLKLDELKESFNEALARYPEFGVQVFIKDNKLVSRINDKDIVFREYGSSPVCFGTDDTNGFMFYVLYGADEITVSYYHGLADVTGMEEYVRCVMYLYSQKIGFELSPEELKELLSSIRESDDIEYSEDLLDPYGKYGDSNVVPQYVFDNRGAYKLPLEEDLSDDAYSYYSEIRFDFDTVLKKTKDLGVSVTPFLLDTLIKGIFSEFDVQGETVITMLPVDMRKYFKSKNVVNFSDSVFLSYTAENMQLPIDKRCSRIKEMIKQQSTPENFAQMMGDKANAVASFEESPLPLNEILAKTNAPQNSDFNPLTLVTTYLGNMTLMSGLDRLVTDMDTYACAWGNAVLARICRNEVRLQVMTTSKENSIAEAVYNSLVNDGYNPKMESNKRMYRDFMMSERLYNE